MVKKNSLKKWIFALAVLLIVAATLVGLLPTGIFDRVAQSIDTAEAADYTYTDGYASFADGSSYTYTDRDKFMDYRNAMMSPATTPTFNAEPLEDDTTTQVVTKTNNNHGSQENPYVINSFDTWNLFQSEMSNETSSNEYGAGKFYALACDLDFDQSSSVRPAIMVSFAGTFYGLGHTLKNYIVTDT